MDLAFAIISPFHSRREAFCLSSGSMDRGQGSYAALLVQLCSTFGATMLPLLVQLCCTFGLAMLDCWYSYAGLTVYLCWTVGIAMLDLWYQNALLFWYCFFNLFTDNIKANLETKFGGRRKSQLSVILASLRCGINEFKIFNRLFIR